MLSPESELWGRVWGGGRPASLELDTEDQWGRLLQGLMLRLISRMFQTHRDLGSTLPAIHCSGLGVTSDTGEAFSASALPAPSQRRCRVSVGARASPEGMERCGELADSGPSACVSGGGEWGVSLLIL